MADSLTTQMAIAGCTFHFTGWGQLQNTPTRHINFRQANLAPLYPHPSLQSKHSKWSEMEGCRSMPSHFTGPTAYTEVGHHSWLTRVCLPGVITLLWVKGWYVSQQPPVSVWCAFRAKFETQKAEVNRQLKALSSQGQVPWDQLLLLLSFHLALNPWHLPFWGKSHHPRHSSSLNWKMSGSSEPEGSAFLKDIMIS